MKKSFDTPSIEKVVDQQRLERLIRGPLLGPISPDVVCMLMELRDCESMKSKIDFWLKFESYDGLQEPAEKALEIAIWYSVELDIVRNKHQELRDDSSEAEPGQLINFTIDTILEDLYKLEEIKLRLIC